MHQFSLEYPRAGATGNCLVIAGKSRRLVRPAAYKAYQSAAVADIWNQIGVLRLKGNVRVQIDARPPDRRIRDLDNLAKPTLDAMQAAAVFLDDSQVAELTIRRLPYSDVLQPGLAVTVQGIP